MLHTLKIPRSEKFPAKSGISRMPPKGWRKNADGTYPQPNRDTEIKSIDEILFPRSTLLRLAKDVLPPGTIISKDSSTAIQRSATVFVNYLMEYARKATVSKEKSMVNGQDVLDALEATGFSEFMEQMKLELDEFNRLQEIKKQKRQQGKLGPEQEEEDQEDQEDQEEDHDAENESENESENELENEAQTNAHGDTLEKTQREVEGADPAEPGRDSGDADAEETDDEK